MRAVSFLFYAIIFASYAAYGPFLVLFLQDVGLTGSQIGLLTGIIPLVTLVSVPFWTRLADATKKHRLILSAALIIGAITIFFLPFLRVFIPILVIGILFNVFSSSVPSFADSATMFMLGDEKDLYPRVRLGGTVGFGLAAPIIGILVENQGLKWAFWSASILFLVGLIISQKFKFEQGVGEESEKGDAKSLLADPGWMLFLVLALTSGIAISAINNYLFSYMKELLLPESIMGIALTVGTLAEIPIMFFGNRLLKRFGINGLLMLGLVMSGLRPLLFALTGSLVPVLLIQLLNGLGFPVMWMAAVAYAEKNAPANLKTTAQGLVGAATFGVGAAIGGFFGGLLLDQLSARQMFGIIGGIVLGMTLIVALIQRFARDRTQ